MSMNTENTAVLPPDPDDMNEQRAAWAGSALDAFVEATRTDDGDKLADLLADLGHWADRNGFDFEAELRRGRMHYAAEIDEPEEDEEEDEDEPLCNDVRCTLSIGHTGPCEHDEDEEPEAEICRSPGCITVIDLTKGYYCPQHQSEEERRCYTVAE